MDKTKLKQSRWSILIAIGVPIIMTFFLKSGLFRNVELKTLDMRFQYRGPADVSHSDLIIIKVDDRTLKDCRDRYPYPREYYATLIENLNDAGVKLIVFDIMFNEPDNRSPEGDSTLAAAIAKADNVILAGKIIKETHSGIVGTMKYLDSPIPKLQATGVDWGIVQESQDDDGFARRYWLLEDYKNEWFYSLGTKVFLSIRGLPGDADFEFDSEEGTFNFFDSTKTNIQKINGHLGSLGYEQTILNNYYGPASTFPSYSMSTLLDDFEFDLKDDEDTDYLEITGYKKNDIYPYELKISLLADSIHQINAFTALAMGDTARVDSIINSENPFKNKVALVGVTIQEAHDLKYTPFFSYGGVNRLTPGVETHAHAIQTMLDGNYIRRSSSFFDISLIFAVSFLTVLVLIFGNPIIGGIGAFVFAAGAVWGAFWLFVNNSVWIYLSPLIAVIGVTYVSDVVFQFILEQKEKRKIRGMFQTYMSSKILKYLEEHPDAFRLTGEKREATMFFSDVQGFTTISESLSAEDLALVLNKYLSPMTDIIMGYDGYVDKYEGDAIMAEFGVPVEDPEHALKACHAALDQQEKLNTVRQEIKRDHGVDIYVRMGINSGLVSAGNMGAKQRFQYTVMGDAVNQASRFEGANKQYGTYLMLGESTYAQVKDKVETRILDKLVVKGKLIPITVYQLLGRKGEISEDQKKIVQFFSEGIQLYWQRRWDDAIEKFNMAISITGEDPPSGVFLNRCNIFKENPPDKKWQGEFIMTTK